MPTQTDYAKPQREPSPDGLLFCAKCGTWLPKEEFHSKQGNVQRYTDYCEACRDRARQSMRLMHARRKAGTQVSKGRPSIDGVLFPVQVRYTVPREILPTLERLFNEKLQEFFSLHRNHPNIEQAKAQYGVTSQAKPPQKGTNRNQPPEPGTQLNTPRPYNDDQQLFLDTCGETMKRRLLKIAKLAVEEKPSFWKQWDLQYIIWTKNGKQAGWNGLNKPLDPQGQEQDQDQDQDQDSSSSKAEES